MRAGLRFLASVLIVSGVLLIADATATLLWQKPLPGDAIGRIEIPAVEVKDYVVEGTETGNLRKGPGHYPETPLPGERGTAAIAGHRTTYGAPFRDIDDLKRGNVIKLDMPYGRYVYRVERTMIVDDSDFSVLRKVRYDRLVLSACHPLYSAAQRVIAFARLVRREPPRVRQS
jgi:sortase A